MKTLYEINKGKKFKNERLAVLVNIKGGSCLLGVPALPASTGEDQYNGVMKLLDEFSIKNKVGGLCFDTTSSITGIHKGALTRICNELGRTLLRMVHFWQTVTGEKTSGPDNPLFKALKNTFENPEYDYDPNKIVKFDWQATKETIIESSAADALTYCKAYVFQKDIVRKDRKELAELVITYLSETNLKIRKPGAVHHARFLSKANYYLKLQLLSKQLDFVKDSNVLKSQINIISEFVCCFYAPWYLKSNESIKAPFLDLTALHQMSKYRETCQCSDADD